MEAGYMGGAQALREFHGGLGLGIMGSFVLTSALSMFRTLND